ncbi:XrtA system polysaccharide deacetylase [Kordiimonas sp. SCSIO 12610]|uniref:XrtA system polysaccharide deacetylase n=1 Tax=Kordiimonas sp. SCSIO 12610 TaxID=2829597 RepID=UPI00210A8534|nr:XrtA system polysaccharide deacetylase [Kordiimonas sp. SCSIO 12610]UTW54152.1 DUF3473 domain-containing protein [Kordiimonas sp. SCSIO 12610]
MNNDAPLIETSIQEIADDIVYDHRHVLSIDVEEWFQVGAYEAVIHENEWADKESRVEYQVSLLLDILSAYNVKATFFTLGYVGARHPDIIKKIALSGHELACHGLDHKRLFNLSSDAFKRDTHKAKSILEDISGKSVIGYRAPSFSLSENVWWVYEDLAEMGFSYSSSIYPVEHDHYGMPAAPKRPFFPNAGLDILEIPMTTYKLMGKTLPVSGGGYFRLLPYFLGNRLFRKGANQQATPGVFYTHPWEYDPDQPTIKQAPFKSRFRHHVGQNSMVQKLHKLLRDYEWGTMEDVIYRPVTDQYGNKP